MIIRIRSRDGVDRLDVPDPSSATVATLISLVETQLHIPSHFQNLSPNQSILLSKSPYDASSLSPDPSTPLSSLGLSHGSILYLYYDPSSFSRTSLPPPPPSFPPRRKMTIDDLVARQVRVVRQDSPHCSLASLDRDSAHSFQLFLSESLAFAVKRGGFLYGRVGNRGEVWVDFIYEPPQHGMDGRLVITRDPEEEKLVEAIAAGLGMRKLGFIVSRSVGEDRGTDGEYTMTAREVRLAAEYQAESGLAEWVTLVVKLEVNEDGGADVHFEAFQMSDVCVKLWKDGWFANEEGEGEGKEYDPKVTKMNKDVVVGGKDMKVVDNDFFLVVVKIADHQGPLSTAFPIENRNLPVLPRALKNHLDRTKSLPFVKRISDFHLLLFLARFLDVNADVPLLAECVSKQVNVPDGYKLLIESMAASA
ncbi:hypothetical protein MLD38_033034 [Melastoma candidum]|uniref:Uncharacterized protein n=1 Tax=Melastoma candidum TaxID=119954 RepID=A0ACB9M5I4_9MYRT|nr:hypothetical protein MLD38_033034 [Melastoma candidum]